MYCTLAFPIVKYAYPIIILEVGGTVLRLLGREPEGRFSGPSFETARDQRTVPVVPRTVLAVPVRDPAVDKEYLCVSFPRNI